LWLAASHDLNPERCFYAHSSRCRIAIGGVIAGIAIYFMQLLWIDPVISLIIGAVITIGTWGAVARIH
jgi:cobalt-zinc-cadmium efflux system protein